MCPVVTFATHDPLFTTFRLVIQPRTVYAWNILITSLFSPISRTMCVCFSFTFPFALTITLTFSTSLFGSEREREREMFYLTTHSTHFIYGYMASDIWLRTILIVRKETRCRHMGYSFRLTARVLLYAPSHRQDSTYHGLCYTSRGALAGTRNSSMGPPHEGSIRRPTAPWANALPLSYVQLLFGSKQLDFCRWFHSFPIEIKF